MKTMIKTLDGLAAGALRRLPWVLLALMVTLVAWQAAGWMWRLWPAPAGASRLVEVDESVRLQVSRHWFGVLVQSGKSASTADLATGSEIAQPRMGPLKLLGVIAGGPRPVALLKADREAFEVTIGESFAEGLRLKSVAPESVVIVRNGREETIIMGPANPESAARTAAVNERTLKKDKP